MTVTFADWSGGQTKKTQGRFRLTLFGHDGSETLLEWLGPDAGGEHSIPIAQVHARLVELSADGWQLVHVSEDRGVFRGTYANEESWPVRQRYLLRHRG